jgi:hypothetical protein
MFFEVQMIGLKKVFIKTIRNDTGFIFLFFIFLSSVRAQNPKPKDSIKQRCLMFNGFASLAVPGGDLASDYGSFGEIGGGIQYQTKSKWLFGLEGGYFFGNGVKKDPIPNLRNEDGNVIGTNGSDAVFKVFQRAVSLPEFRFGKTFQFSNKQGRNSLGGFTAVAGGSWFRSWTYIQDLSKKTPQFSDEIRKGYDRLRSGPSASFWLGYLYLPDNGKLNFHFEAGYTHAFSKTNRYDFTTQEPAGIKRNDGLFQLKVRLCFVVKSRSEETEYYY